MSPFSPDFPAAARVDAVVIGRNEGARLVACLHALNGQVRRVIYVDSGSTDASIADARRLGAEVVALDLSRPFTAARARNAGLARLDGDPPDFVQLIDGDCSLDAGWIAAALAAFADHPRAVVVCGRRRERFPAASVYNRLADREWDTPLGLALACGGDALMRYGAVMAVGGFREALIAGEEPELCLRLVRAGGEIWRIAAEMTLHDAAMLRFGQWWQRTRRAGHAYAEGAALHANGPEGHWRVETKRALFWGAALPVLIAAGGLLWPPALLALLVYPAQVARLTRRMGFDAALFNVIGKFAEAQGVLGFMAGRLTGQRRGLIEYK